MDGEKRRRLLFLDDEPNILKSLSRAFFADDYDIATFTSPSEALEYLNDHRVELIIADQRMPEMTGTQFLVKAKELDPKAIRMVLTAYADIEAAVEAINQASSYEPKTWANIVCPTNRRPYGYDWEDWGRLDALEVLAIE